MTEPRSRFTAVLPAGVAASIAACSPGPVPAPPSPGPPPVVIPSASPSAEPAPAPEPEPLDAIAALRPYAVTHARAARRVLYTWTTREQLEELARDRILLTRESSPTRGDSIYDQAVGDRAEAGDRLARILRGDRFRRARFAWPAPWATLLGWEGETYGEELIRIELRPEAYIVKLLNGRPGWEVVDLEDRPVPVEEVLRRPERIGAVYFVQEQISRRRGTYAGTFAGTLVWTPYREYVICNEGMVASWAIHTEAIARELDAGAGALAALGRHLGAHPIREPEPIEAWMRRLVTATWPGPEPEAAPLDLYEAALAFPNQRYRPSPGDLVGLARKLREIAGRRGGPALTYAPAPPP